MIASMFKTMAQVITRTSSDVNSSAKTRRVNRRYPLCQGIEGLELRLPPASIAPVIVTITNLPPVTSPTTTTTTETTTIATLTPTTTTSYA